MKGKSQIAIDMVKRAIDSGIYADYLLVDSWYSKPLFLQAMNDLGLKVISRMTNNNSIWNFTGEEKTLDALYTRYQKIKPAKTEQNGKKIRYTYFSVTVKHHKAGKVHEPQTIGGRNCCWD